jgi:hypothetical protein
MGGVLPDICFAVVHLERKCFHRQEAGEAWKCPFCAFGGKAPPGNRHASSDFHDERKATRSFPCPVLSLEGRLLQHILVVGCRFGNKMHLVTREKDEPDMRALGSGFRGMGCCRTYWGNQVLCGEKEGRRTCIGPSCL